MIIFSSVHSQAWGARKRPAGRDFLHWASSQLRSQRCLVMHQGHGQSMRSIELNMQLRPNPNRFAPAGPDCVTWTRLEWQPQSDTLLIKFGGITVMVFGIGPSCGH